MQPADIAVRLKDLMVSACDASYELSMHWRKTGDLLHMQIHAVICKLHCRQHTQYVTPEMQTVFWGLDTLRLHG